MSNGHDLGSTASLANVNRRLQAVLDNASVSIFLMDDRQKCIYMNAAAEQLTGYTLDEVLALDRPLHDIIHHQYPDGRPFPLHECAIDRAFPEHSRMRGEETFVHRDGHFYPVAYCASPIEDDASQTIGTIIEVRDITAEKRAAQQQRVMVNELNHRVKNTLAIVQALARQTLLASDPVALASFTRRLAALSRAHDVLTSNAWEAALMEEVVESVIRPFGADRFTITGPPVRIAPNMALSLSMALHELATNAAKYGALGTENGRVSVSWDKDTGDAGDVLTMVWAESGGPPVQAPERSGFGMRMIEGQLAHEFGGGAKLSFEPSGLVCRMHLRLRDDASSEPLRP